MDDYVSPLSVLMINIRHLVITTCSASWLFIKNLFLQFLCFLKGLFITKNFTIKKISLECETSSEYKYPSGWWHFFWSRKLRDIEPKEKFSTEVGFYYGQGFLKDIIKEAPSGIINIKIIVKYIYNDNLYIYVTRNPEFCWPPKKVPGLNPKIVKANWVITNDDLTRYITSYAGPYNDFHGEELTLDDIDIDEDIKLVNQFNLSTVIRVDQKFSRRNLVWTT